MKGSSLNNRRIKISRYGNKNKQILKERYVIETNVKKILEKLNWFRRYSILKCPYVSKKSNKMAGNAKIKA